MSSFPGSKTDKSGPFPDRGLPDLLFSNEVRFGRKADIQIRRTGACESGVCDAYRGRSTGVSKSSVGKG
jgi:hypothetical protein